MVVIVVEIHVRKDKVDDFIRATVDNHRMSVKEPGNLRFDILQSCEEPCRFTLYEAYLSEEAASCHKKTDHYLRWRETVADWMERPRVGIAHKVIEPLSLSSWQLRVEG